MTKREVHFGASDFVSQVSPEMLGSILAHACDIAITIDRDWRVYGVLVNPNVDPLGEFDHWVGKSLKDFLTSESSAKLVKRLAEMDRADQNISRPLELNHVNSDFGEIPILHTIHRTGRADMFIMLGRDLRPIAEAQQKLVETQLELERDYEKYRISEKRYNVAMEATSDALIFVDAQNGRVIDANGAASQLLGCELAALKGSSFAAWFEERQHPEFLAELRENATDRTGKAVKARTVSDRKRLKIASSVFRSAGDTILLCQVYRKDQVRSADGDFNEALGALYQNSPDAIAIADADGTIQHVNKGFLALGDLAQFSDAKGRALSEFLARGGVDLRVMLENTARTGKLRAYATKFESALGSIIPVEITVTSLQESPSSTFAFVFRETPRTGVSKDLGFALSDDAERNIMELVGSSKLKDIVSATTDVVERMCIEAAVTLTGNNRVAAAEMLGLSRQSLYVKLRKYGLLEKKDGS
ncbi:MAG: transcriptional regulator PpsR [Pseudomonadota bacterium]